MRYFIHDLKSALKLKKGKKGLSLISLLGLVLGYSSFFLILSYCWFEKNYDRFHKDADLVYRLSYNRYSAGNLLWETANSFFPVGKYLNEVSPDVTDFTTLARNYNITVAAENNQKEAKVFSEEKSYYVSSSFFSVFSFPVVKGKVADMDKPNIAFITEKGARKYFREEDPVGKILKVNGDVSYMVAGVLKDIPANSHLKFDLLFSLQTHVDQLGHWVIDHWYGYDLFYNYIKLRKGADPEKVATLLPQMVEKKYGKNLAVDGMSDVFSMTPLVKLHLYSNLEYEPEKPGNGDAVNILIYFSIFVLLITWLNHVNLISAQESDRAKEVGLRKTLGGSRTSLILKFITEITLKNLLGIFITASLLITFYQMLPKPSPLFPIETYSDELFWLTLAIVISAGVLVAAIVPSLSMSRYNPVDVLKGNLIRSSQKLLLRKVLITFQFVLSFILITGALIVYQQGVFLINQDRGIDQSSVLTVKFPKILNDVNKQKEHTAVFHAKVKALPWVKDFTVSTDVPGKEIENFGSVYRPQVGVKDRKDYFRIGADENFFKMYQGKLLAGRFFSKDLPTDKATLIINRGALKKIGFNSPEEAIGKVLIDFSNKETTIIGVVEDFHFKSIKVKPVPVLFNYQDEGISYFSLKLSNKIKREQLAELTTIYESIFPGNPMDYKFLEDAALEDLQPDLDFARIFGILSLLSIIISITGLLGLVIINLNHRIKEIGIRKVVGASFNDLCLLVIKKFSTPILLALLIGIPLSVWGFSKWINEYYIYHIPIRWIYFFIPAVTLPLLAVFVIILQVKKVDRQNTIKALKWE